MTGPQLSAMNVGPLNPDANQLAAFAPGRLEVPTTAAVIVHPSHGVVLWDRGINDAV
jgi:N-acyl homoserine lactone hydrolase